MSSSAPSGLVLPQAIESERVVLGTMLIEPETIPTVIERLGPEGQAFYSEVHREVYLAIVTIGDNGDLVVEPTTVMQELRRRQRLGDMDLAVLLAQIEASVLAPESIEAHLRQVLEVWRMRRLITVCQRTLEEAQAAEESVGELLDKAERDIFSIANENNRKGTPPIQELTSTVLEEIESRQHDRRHISGLASGFDDLDKMTSGFQATDLLIIGARPSMGKTAFALNIAQHVAVRLRKPVGLFSLEMGGNQLAQRMLASLARVPLHKVRSGKLDKRDMDELAEHGQTLADAPLYIDDTAGLSILEMRSKARRWSVQAGGQLGLIVIDYLQLMSGGGGRSENRQQEISEISRSLKQLARELNVPVVALSQLSRQTEQRKGKDKRPILSDLRESGAIEQDADVVMFVHREDYYKRKEVEGANNAAGAMGGGQQQPRKTGLVIEPAEIIVAKQRNGPTGVVELYFQAELARFLSKSFSPAQTGGSGA